MANVDRRWIAPAMLAAAFAASAIAYTRLPSAVTPRMTELLPFSVPDNTEAGPRWMAAFLLPSLAVVLWAGFRFAASDRAQRFGRWFVRSAPVEVTTAKQFERFAKTYETIAIGVISLILGMHAGFLAASFQRPTTAARIIGMTLALFLVVVGNVMPRLRANWVAGLRTKATLADPDLWRTAHRAFGMALVSGGIVTFVVALAAPRYALVTGMGLLLLACLVGFATTTGRRGAKSPAVVAGFALLLGSGASDAQANAGRAPAAVVAPSSVVEEATTFERDGLVLHGTLTLPSAPTGRVPVVVIIAGSGPTDRNANGPLINTNAYAQLAWGLAQVGVASLRYDKRGIGETGGVGDPSQLSMDDYVADAKRAAERVARDSRFGPVFMLGHSEGAGLGLMAANRGAPVSGVIMVAPQGRPITEVLHEQLARQIDSAGVRQFDAAFARYLRGEEPGAFPPATAPLLSPPLRRYMQSMAAYDPCAEAKRFGGPLLVVQGTTDLQVSMKDAEAIYAAQPRATLARLDGVNHVLKSAPSMDPRAQTAIYQDPKLPLAPSVVQTIAGWIHKLER
jgi:fermentation-respiration switch protein FrsA (DUF1100 family)